MPTSCTIPGITLTGADASTCVQELVELAATHPALEVGLLYSATPEGRNRYPSLEWIHAAAQVLHGRCALHVCGAAARTRLMSGELDDILPSFARVQVNGTVAPEEIDAIARHARTLILQWQPGRDTGDLTRALASAVHAHGLHHQWLVDGSGGRGRLPATWERPDGEAGFAGGLGPDTLATALPDIAAIATGSRWVDMENSLRTDDRFDLAKCRQVLAVLEAWRRQVKPEPAAPAPRPRLA